MKIKNVEVGNIFLAPMAGVTDVGFRHVCKMCGADLTYTEMVSAKALIHDSDKTKELLTTSPIETPKAVQIFGHEAEVMAEVCKSPFLEKFDVIDINFGCPAPKIVKNGDGSALLKDLLKIKSILDACTKMSNKPITCKFRVGFNDGENIAVELAKICEESGASAITVHGRTREQMYSGSVDLETIAKVKSVVKIPVIGNGDVVDLASYNKMKQTGVDGVMIGRGSLGNPNIFNELKNTNFQFNKLDIIQKHIEVLKQNYNEKYVSLTMRKHLLWYVSGAVGASKVKAQISTEENIDKSLQLIKDFLQGAII